MVLSPWYLSAQYHRHFVGYIQPYTYTNVYPWLQIAADISWSLRNSRPFPWTVVVKEQSMELQLIGASVLHQRLLWHGYIAHCCTPIPSTQMHLLNGSMHTAWIQQCNQLQLPVSQEGGERGSCGQYSYAGGVAILNAHHFSESGSRCLILATPKWRNTLLVAHWKWLGDGQHLNSAPDTEMESIFPEWHSPALPIEPPFAFLQSPA